MALLTKTPVGLAGATPALVAAAGGGDTFSPSNNGFLQVKNAGGSPITVTIVTPGTVAGQAVADVTVSVPATTGERWIGPLPGSLFARASDGLGDITYSGVTSVTVGYYELDPSIA